MKKHSKAKKIFFIILPFVCILIIYFLAVFFSKHTYVFGQCNTYTLFSIHCPGCGTTRACLALLNGDIITSLRQNCLVIFGILVSAWMYIEFIFYLFEKKPPFTVFKLNYLWAFLIFLGVYTVARNIFPVLAPF